MASSVADDGVGGGCGVRRGLRPDRTKLWGPREVPLFLVSLPNGTRSDKSSDCPRLALPDTPGGPPLGRGVSCEAVACQLKRDTVHIEKSFQKCFGNSKRPRVGLCRQVVEGAGEF